MIVHLVDGTYELFRHFYGLRRFTRGSDRPLGAVVGVLQSVLQMIEQGATHVGVATDHVIESFRNELWPGYKTGGRNRAGAGGAVPSARGGARRHGRGDLADGRARGRRCARLGSAHGRRRQGGGEGLHLDARTRTWRSACAAIGWCRSTAASKAIRDAAGVRAKFGVAPELIPDWLALVGDAADGYPGIAGIGAVGAARLLNRHGPIEAFAPSLLGEQQALALLFKRLATLRTDAKLFRSVDALRWRGPTAAFAAWTESAGVPRLLERSRAASGKS